MTFYLQSTGFCINKPIFAKPKMYFISTEISGELDHLKSKIN